MVIGKKRIVLYSPLQTDPRGGVPYSTEITPSSLLTIAGGPVLAECALAAPSVWPFRPRPGTEMFREAVAQGYRPPQTLLEWANIGEYRLDSVWDNRIPEAVDRRERLLGDSARAEAKASNVLGRLGRRLGTSPATLAAEPKRVQPMGRKLAMATAGPAPVLGS